MDDKLKEKPPQTYTTALVVLGTKLYKGDEHHSSLICCFDNGGMMRYDLFMDYRQKSKGWHVKNIYFQHGSKMLKDRTRDIQHKTKQYSSEIQNYITTNEIRTHCYKISQRRSAGFTLFRFSSSHWALMAHMEALSLVLFLSIFVFFLRVRWYGYRSFVCVLRPHSRHIVQIVFQTRRVRKPSVSELLFRVWDIRKFWQKRATGVNKLSANGCKVSKAITYI